MVVCWVSIFMLGPSQFQRNVLLMSWPSSELDFQHLVGEAWLGELTQDPL